MKKLLSVSLILCMLLTFFAGCSKKEDKKGAVYYLNFKPEQDAAWQELAKEYTNQTGVEVKVFTAAEGTYETTLTSEIEKSNPPTLFQVNGAVGLEKWKDYCLDLSSSSVYTELTSNDFALSSGGKIYGVAYVYEGFGIIVNKKLLKDAGYEIGDIKGFDDLKNIAEDITARKDELGFSAFGSAGLDSSSSWRFSGHLANIPLYYQFTDDNVKSQPATITNEYLDKYKNLWDLYINNSIAEPTVLSTKTSDDAVAEFTESKVVFYQNGTWEYDKVKAIGDENLGYIPIYAGVDDAEQGLCCGTENYWAVNSRASEVDQKATLDFLNWVVTSEQGTTALADKMGFVSPFKKAKKTKNVLCNIMNDYVAEGRYNVSWEFNYTPNVDKWRSGVVSALTQYSAGKADWQTVEKAFVDGWAEQYAASHK